MVFICQGNRDGAFMPNVEKEGESGPLVTLSCIELYLSLSLSPSPRTSLIQASIMVLGGGNLFE